MFALLGIKPRSTDHRGQIVLAYTGSYLSGTPTPFFFQRNAEILNMYGL
jgi:hypothetical protein